MKFITRLFNSAIEHYFLSILLILISPTTIVIYLKKINPLSTWLIPFIKWNGSGWVVAAIFLFALIFLQIRNHFFQKSKIIKNWFSDPPKFNANHDNKTFEREYAGVIWKVIAGSDVEPGMQALPREAIKVWVYPNPRCPKCGYQLERYKNRWHCTSCEVNYKIPKKLRDHTWEKIRRIFETYLVQWGHNNFGIAEEQSKPLRVQLEEIKEKQKSQV